MQVNVPPDAPLPPQIFVGRSPVPEWVAPFIAVIIFAVIGAVMLWPLVRAWAKRIEGRGAESGFAEELAQLRERVAELEHTGAHMAELEERLDFAERLLSQRSERENLPAHRTPV